MIVFPLKIPWDMNKWAQEESTAEGKSVSNVLRSAAESGKERLEKKKAIRSSRGIKGKKTSIRIDKGMNSWLGEQARRLERSKVEVFLEAVRCSFEE